MIDIVFPKGNEHEFVKMAEKLGYDSLCLMDTEKLPKSDLTFYRGSITTKSVKRGKVELVIMNQPPDVRRAVEKIRPDILFGAEPGKTDFLHQRNSGLNHIICRAAYDKKVAIGFTISSVKDSRMLGRIRQNIRLCRKYNVKMIVASLAKHPFEMRAPKDIISLFSTIGMHPKEAKESLLGALDIISENIKKKSPKYIAEGAEIV